MSPVISQADLPLEEFVSAELVEQPELELDRKDSQWWSNHCNPVMLLGASFVALVSLVVILVVVLVAGEDSQSGTIKSNGGETDRPATIPPAE